MFRTFQASSLLLVVGLALLSGTTLEAQKPAAEAWKAPSRAKRKKNPFTSTAEVIKEGKALYLSACMVCHGNKGKGDGPASAALNPKPKDLTNPEILKLADGELHWKIRTGKAPMPAFGAALKSKQIWKIIVFLRDLEHQRAGYKPIQVPDPKTATHRILIAYQDLLGKLKSKNWTPTSRAKAKDFSKTVRALKITTIKSKKDKETWLAAKARLEQGAATLSSAKNKNFVEGFQQITQAVNALMSRFGNPEKKQVSLLVCKMGPSKGGNLWLQIGSTKVQNPFPWGKKMPTCGERLKTYPSLKSARSPRTTK